MSDPITLGPDRPGPGSTRRLKPARVDGYAPVGMSGSRRLSVAEFARRSLDLRPDARVTLVGLALVAPLALAMMTGSSTLILLASGLVLAGSLLSPISGLIAVAFMAPFPRPLEIPTPGLYVAILGAIFMGTVLRLPIDRPRLRWPTLEVSLIGAFLVYVTANFVGGRLFGLASARGSSIASLYSQMLTGILTFIAANLVLRGRSPYPVLAALLLSALLASAMALAQYVGAELLFGDLMGGGELQGRTAVDRATGPFLDPNYFGAYLAAATTLGVACAVIAHSRALKIVTMALSAFVGVALVLTLSRGALVALAAGLVTVAFTRGRRAGFLTLAAMLLAALVAWPLFADVRYAANPDIAAAGLGSQLESSGRTGAWLGGLEVFLSSPVFGVGFGRTVDLASSGITSHNWYVGLLAETGITGLVLWALFIAASVLALRNRPPTARTLGYSVLAAWMVASVFIEVPRIYATSGVVLIVLAAAIAADWTLRDRDAEQSEIHLSTRHAERATSGG